MVITTHQTLYVSSSSLTLLSSSQSKKTRKQNQLKRRQSRETDKSTSLSFPKSSPTPLLINKPYPQTKLEALDAVVSDIETSIEKGITIGAEIFASLLETCYRLKAVDHGVRIHRLIPSVLLRKNSGISSKLLRLYASCGLIDTAHELFDKMSKRNECTFAWNSLISAYAESGQYEGAMALYFQMEEENVEPDRFTFPRVLKACGGIGSIGIGEAVHRDLVRAGFAQDEFVLNSLVDMYAKCGDIVKARRVFDKITSKDIVSWNTMLTGYIRHDLLLEAFDIFRQMIRNKVDPDSVAISTVVANVWCSKLGSQIHGFVIRRSFELEIDLSVANSLILMYSKHRKLNQASWVFDRMPEKDIVSWNSIISAHGKTRKALMYFKEMEKSGVQPNVVTFVLILSVCAHLGFVKVGKRYFQSMKEKYKISPVMEHYACLVNLYSRSGFIDEAYSIIVDEMEFEAGPTVWGALLYGCYLHGNVDVGEIASQRLFELEPDNELNFELLIKLYEKVKRPDDVERVRQLMSDRGLDIYTDM